MRSDCRHPVPNEAYYTTVMLIYYGQELRTYLLGGRFEINSNSCYVSIACHHEMKGREHLKYRAS